MAIARTIIKAKFVDDYFDMGLRLDVANILSMRMYLLREWEEGEDWGCEKRRLIPEELVRILYGGKNRGNS